MMTNEKSTTDQPSFSIALLYSYCQNLWLLNLTGLLNEYN